MQFAILGSGSWATALAKILTDNGQKINWWIRNHETIRFLKQRRHNPHYLRNAYFNTNLLELSESIHYVVEASEVVVLAIPSAYAGSAISVLNADAFRNKKIVSAIKGIIPEKNLLVHEYLQLKYNFPLEDYFTLLGPCHSEEVAAEKLSYLTFSGVIEEATASIASYFITPYIKTITNSDVIGVQYAAIVKNIYALGAGIAHGLEYGDNFQSVYIANAANEMTTLLGAIHAGQSNGTNYAASVYLGDLLVTCYSLYSRNRMFGNMLGKGYSVKAAQLELDMVAEGYNASKCIHVANEKLGAHIPIADILYDILWNSLPASEGFEKIEHILI